MMASEGDRVRTYDEGEGIVTYADKDGCYVRLTDGEQPFFLWSQIEEVLPVELPLWVGEGI